MADAPAVLLVCVQGIEPEIRPEVWKFLLGLYPCDSTTEERERIRSEKVYA